jgi:AraC family transcriptional regulator
MPQSARSNSASSPAHNGNETRSSTFLAENPAQVDGLTGVKTQFVALRPGMMASLYNGDGRHESHVELLNDSQFVHFSCLLRGTTEFTVRGDSHIHSTGQGHAGYSPGEWFSARHCRNFRQVGLMLDPGELTDCLEEKSEPFVRELERGFVLREVPDTRRILHAANILAQRIERASTHPLLLQSAALEFLGHYFDEPTSAEQIEHLPNRERKQLQQARERLLQDLSAPPTIAELARETGLNQLKLKQGFKTLFGNSIYALFQKHRMDRAHYLLRDHNVTETALILGYTNVSHFSTAYRKQFGVLPSQTRKNVSASRICTDLPTRS